MHFSRVSLKFSGKAAAQNLGPRFVRACAVEMHVYISEEPLYTEIHRKNATAQLEPRTRTHCASLRSRNALQHVTRATSHGNLEEKCRAPEPRTTLCASLRSRNACQEPPYGKVPRPSLSPEPGDTLCASMRSRNAFQHFTRATLNGNSQVKCRRPEAIGAHFVRACAVERLLHFNTCHESHFVRKFTGKTPQTRMNP